MPTRILQLWCPGSALKGRRCLRLGGSDGRWVEVATHRLAGAHELYMAIARRLAQLLFSPGQMIGWLALPGTQAGCKIRNAGPRKRAQIRILTDELLTCVHSYNAGKRQILRCFLSRDKFPSADDPTVLFLYARYFLGKWHSDRDSAS